MLDMSLLLKVRATLEKSLNTNMMIQAYIFSCSSHSLAEHVSLRKVSAYLHFIHMDLYILCVCVRVCVRACVRACVRVCMYIYIMIRFKLQIWCKFIYDRLS
jgi:hypothetical protein